MALCTGWIALDGGRLPLARPLYDEARELAATAGEAVLSVHVLTNQSMLDAEMARTGPSREPARQAAVSPDQDAARHGPVLDRLFEIIRRGQDSGDFDRTLPSAWLLTAALAPGRAAEDEVKAGRMTIEQASHVVHHSFLRLSGLPDDPGRR